MLNNLFSPAFLVNSLLLILVFQISACSDTPEVNNQTQQQPQAVPTNVAEQAAVTPPASSAVPATNTGTVKSNQVAGSYSYIETDIEGSTFWIATAASASKVGEKISWNDYAMMKNFTSKALNKTFDQIMFVDNVRSASTPVSSSHSGTVVETMNASGYSYIHVEEQGKRVWLAAPETVISVGQTINWSGGSAMQNFSSRALDRTFDEIFFVGAIQVTSG